MSGEDSLAVLHVEDEPEIHLLLKTTLKQCVDADINVTWASRGKEALKRARRNRYDLIFLDYVLPDMDGLRVMEKLRAANVEAPVVMLTGKGDENVATEAYRNGVLDYLPKDFKDMDELKQRLGIYIDTAQNIKQARTDISSFDDLNRKRDGDVILGDILRAAVNGAKKTRIMQKANVNSQMIKKYLRYAISNGYIERRTGKRNPIYATTKKGTRLLECIGRVRTLLE